MDWEREAFTMDARLSKGVEEAFVRMFDSGYIYRDTRLVSWCPYLKTALSDIEVDPMEVSKPDRIRIPGYEKTVEVGMLWHFKYPVKGQAARYVEVATTRLETMLGDVAVAVHPEDVRYKDLVGCELEHPFLPERKIVVVSDTYVSQEFGTGAVKITPAHDKNDYDLGRRHKLPMINVFTLDGMMNDDAGEFAGQHRFECRVKLEKRLEELGLMGEKVPNTKAMQIPRCSRSNDVIEYMLMPQWYVDCKSAAARATAAVRQGDLRIVPEMYEKTWFQWLDNIKDWCISRQLWWGHQIPAYRVIEPAQEPEVWVAAKSMEEAEAKARAKLNCESVKMQRDEDVLDTWFSSGLFPFSTLGWPEDTPDFRSFFPNTMLETGHDILFFWVARMVMMSFILLDCLPFHTVYLHAMVRDAHGKKMSKSLGNVIDPIEVIEGITLPKMQANLQNNTNLSEKEIKRATDAQKKDFPKGIPECGADALRYGMLAYTKQGRNINLDVQRVIGYRHFCNKLWNATKFALLYFPKDFQAQPLDMDKLQWIDKWILHCLNECKEQTNTQLQTFQFSDAVNSTYRFWLYELCDVYLEAIKPRLQVGSDVVALNVLLVCLDEGLRMLHPMVPFVTEELYQKIPLGDQRCKSICIAPYPQADKTQASPQVAGEFDALMSVIRTIRSFFAQLEIPPKEKPQLNVVASGDIRSLIGSESALVSTLAKSGSLTLVDNHAPGRVVGVAGDSVSFSIDPTGTVNLAQIVQKLQKKIAQASKQIEGYERKMCDPSYETKVPIEVRQTNEQKLDTLRSERASLQEAEDSVKNVVTQ